MQYVQSTEIALFYRGRLHKRLLDEQRQLWLGNETSSKVMGQGNLPLSASARRCRVRGAAGVEGNERMLSFAACVTSQVELE
jgi:hypothetical protein